MFRLKIIKKNRRRPKINGDVSICKYKNPNHNHFAVEELERVLIRHPDFCRYQIFKITHEELQSRGYQANGTGTYSPDNIEDYHPLPQISLFIHKEGANLAYQKDTSTQDSQITIVGPSQATTKCKKCLEEIFKELENS